MFFFLFLTWHIYPLMKGVFLQLLWLAQRYTHATNFECEIRKLALETAEALLGPSPRVYDALQLLDCDSVQRPTATSSTSTATAVTPDNDKDKDKDTIYVDCANGSDNNNGKDLAFPLKTIQAGIDKNPSGTVVLRAGTCHLNSTINLSSKNSGITITTLPGEEAILSGARVLSNLDFEPSSFNPKILQAKTALTFRPTSLFLNRQRMVWARTPNGNPELDLQPENWAKCAGVDKTVYPPFPPGGEEGAEHFTWGGGPTKEQQRVPSGGGRLGSEGGRDLVPLRREWDEVRGWMHALELDEPDGANGKCRRVGVELSRRKTSGRPRFSKRPLGELAISSCKLQRFERERLDWVRAGRLAGEPWRRNLDPAVLRRGSF